MGCGARTVTEVGPSGGEEHSRDVNSMTILGKPRLGFRIPQVGTAPENTLGFQLNPKRAPPQEYELPLE